MSRHLKQVAWRGKATIEMNIDDIGHGDRVVIHDDLLATGGTAIAAAKLVIQQGAVAVSYTHLTLPTIA